MLASLSLLPCFVHWWTLSTVFFLSSYFFFWNCLNLARYCCSTGDSPLDLDDLLYLGNLWPFYRKTKQNFFISSFFSGLKAYYWFIIRCIDFFFEITRWCSLSLSVSCRCCSRSFYCVCSRLTPLTIWWVGKSWEISLFLMILLLFSGLEGCRDEAGQWW